MSIQRTTTYSVHPGVSMVKKWVDALPEKTGKSIEQWATLIQKQKIENFTKRKQWLKTVHGFGGNEAGWLAEYSQGRHTWDFDPAVYLEQAERYVAEQYVGAKATLKPVFDAVVEFVLSLGPDVRICPCKTIVPLYRKRVFGELKAATRTRLELSLALDEFPFTERLVANPRAKGNDRLRHQFHLFALNDFDAEIKKTLTLAYENDA